MGQCPPELMQIRGYSDMKLFDAIAVQWSRGPHQPVSIRLLAKSLGATATLQQRLCHGNIAACCRQMAGALAEHRDQHTRQEGRCSEATGIELGTAARDEEVGWHHGIESTTGEASMQVIANPLRSQPAALKRGI
jgi:hypothetical protein